MRIRMNFDAFVKDIQENQWNVFGVEIYEDGALTHRYGDTFDNRHPIYSATKTITSLAVGLAIDEGKLKLDESILNYLPLEAVRNLPKKQLETYKSISMERLLTMSVQGYPFRPEGDSWLSYSLNVPLENVNERSFEYNNVAAYLVGVATSCAVNQDLYDYLERKLFQPLGIINPPFERCPEGYFYGASKMELTVNELSRIGLLLYNNGVYAGKRIISPEYIKAATSMQQTNREDGYGYLIWKYGNGCSINGKFMQRCYILPDERKVITYLSHIEHKSCELIDSMKKNILMT